MSEETVKAWMKGYLKAWESNEPDDIRALFTEGAVYAFNPSDPEPLRGAESIVEGWLTSKDEPGTWSFEWETLFSTGELAVLTGKTEYPAGTDYDNLWVIRFAPDGRATEFTEWYMKRPGQG